MLGFKARLTEARDFKVSLMSNHIHGCATCTLYFRILLILSSTIAHASTLQDLFYLLFIYCLVYAFCVVTRKMFGMTIDQVSYPKQNRMRRNGKWGFEKGTEG